MGVDYLFLVILGMSISLILVVIGFHLGKHSNPVEVKEVEIEDDFPKTLDGKFYSTTAAIRSMSDGGDNS